MKFHILAAIVASLVVQACNQAAQEQAAAPVEGVFSATHSATGVLTAVNDDTVMIDHGPVTALDWPAMTMTYEVQDPAIVANLQAGQQISFSFRREGFGYVLTEIAQR